MSQVHTDCRTEAGVTVGLIDALITICRVLAKRDLSSDPGVREAPYRPRPGEDYGAVTEAAVNALLLTHRKS